MIDLPHILLGHERFCYKSRSWGKEHVGAGVARSHFRSNRGIMLRSEPLNRVGHGPVVL